MKFIVYLLLTIFISTGSTVVFADSEDYKSSYQETNEPDPLPDKQHGVLYIYAVGNEAPDLKDVYLTLNDKAFYVINWNTYSTFVLPAGDCHITTVNGRRIDSLFEMKPNKNYYLEIKNTAFFLVGLTSEKTDFEKVKYELKKVKLIPDSKLAIDMNEYNRKLEEKRNQ